MKSKLSTIGFVTLVAGLGLTVSSGAFAQAVMKMASAAINDVQHEWLKRFDAAIKPRVGNKLQIEIYPAGQLGQIPRMIEGVTVGTIESFVTPSSFLVSTEPRYQVLDAIGVFQSTGHLNRVLRDDSYRRRVLALGESKGLKGIAVMVNVPIIVLSKQPITTLADFKGKKIRVFPSPLQVEPMKMLGAFPIPMPFGEVMAALQTGTIDGMLAGTTVLTPFKFYDAAKAVTEIHFSYVTSILVANKKWFESLPTDVQAAVLETAARIDGEALDIGNDLLDRANKGWIGNGGQLLRLPPSEQNKMLADLKILGANLLSAKPEIKTEYDELVRVADRLK